LRRKILAEFVSEGEEEVEKNCFVKLFLASQPDVMFYDASLYGFYNTSRGFLLLQF
jgi:hypothetical protein